MKHLMDEGYLSQVEFFAPTKPNLKGVKMSTSMQYGSDYAEGEIAKIMGEAKIAVDIIQFWLANGQDRPTIAFCCNVLHANFLTVEFQKVGVKAEVMVGNTPKSTPLKRSREVSQAARQPSERIAPHQKPSKARTAKEPHCGPGEAEAEKPLVYTSASEALTLSPSTDREL